eukprot:m51a1_g10183 hypothetical protein (291) ;mRNA; r:84435-89077
MFNTIFDKLNLQRYKANLKPEVCSWGTLHVFMNDNGERWPMHFDAMYSGSGNRLGRSEMLTVFGNPDEQRILMLIWLIQNPNTSKEQLLKGMEEAIMNYLNKFLCIVMFETRTMYIICILNPDEGYNCYLHKGAMDVMLFLKADGSHVAYLPGKKHIIKLDTFDLWNASLQRLFFMEMVFADPENEYRGKEFLIKTCLKHIFNYFMNKNEDVYWWLIEWLAQRLQCPFNRSCSIPILVSEEGIGKDLLLSDTMMAIISKYHLLNTTSPKNITGKFNAVLEGKIYMVYNET